MGKPWEKKRTNQAPSAKPDKTAQPAPSASLNGFAGLGKAMGYDIREPEPPKEDYTVHAPYNFVPFSNTVLFPYASAEELPRHDKYDEKLHTGEIRVSLKAETPVFVSDGNNSFIKNGNGQLTIPGSTVKGMFRENAQILGFGLVSPGEDFDDYQIYYRAVASKDKELKDYYNSVLDVKQEGNVSRATGVSGGYIRCEGRNYYIYPVGDFKRIKRYPIETDPPEYEVRDIEGAPAVDATGMPIGNAMAKCVELKSGKYLLCPGRPVSKKGSPAYLFPAPDWSVDRVDVTEKDALSYKEDFEAKRNVLSDPGYWKLPEDDGDFKPIFYTIFEGHVYMGMCQFIRVGYKYKLSHGLSANHRKYVDAEGVPIDYPHALFGFSRGKSSYRSRVSVGDFCADQKYKEGSRQTVALMGPKPSWYNAYLGSGKNYNDDDFKLRGYKQYWLKTKAKIQNTGNDNENIGSEMRPASAGTVFKGTIRYTNLNDKELGLLLWSIRLNSGCFQSIGMGKPYGFGRMKVTIEKLSEFSPKAAYSSLTASTFIDITDKVDSLIGVFDKNALQRQNKLISDQQNIQDFFFIKSKLQDGGKASYMALGDYSVTDALPTIEGTKKQKD